MIGDIIREESPGKIGLGNFYEDEQVFLESLEKVAALESNIIYLSHGSHINDIALRYAIETIKVESGKWMRA